MIRDLELTGATFSAHADKESVRFSVQCTDDVVEDCVATVAEHLCAPINADKYYYVAENSGAATLGAAAHAASGTAQVHDLLHEAAYGAGASPAALCLRVRRTHATSWRSAAATSQPAT